MATGLTELDIWNGALDILSQSRPVTTAEKAALSTPDARWFDRNFSKTVRELLRANVWTFAKDLEELTADGTPPAFDFLYRYAVPADWVRVLPITQYGFVNGAPIPHEIAGSWIYTDDAGPLKVRGVQDMQDPDDWDHLFVPVVEAALARKYALKLTGKANYAKMADDAFQTSFDIAVTVGAIEEPYEVVEAHDIVRVREL